MTFEISGSIEDDCVEADSCYGTSYHISANFDKILLDSIHYKLGKKYLIEIGENVNMELAAKQVKLYLSDFRSMLNDYKDGTYFDYYFSEKYLRGYVQMTLNAETQLYFFAIDQSNDKVIVDYSAGEYGWQGELEMEEYLQHIVAGDLCLKKCEIKCKNYSKENCNCSECN